MCRFCNDGFTFYFNRFSLALQGKNEEEDQSSSSDFEFEPHVNKVCY